MFKNSLAALAAAVALVGPALAADAPAELKIGTLYASSGRYASISMPVYSALKLWAVIRWYGAQGLRAHVRNSVGLAQQFADQVSADDRFELIAPHELALVTFRLRAGDEATRAVMDEVTTSGLAPG